MSDAKRSPRTATLLGLGAAGLWAILAALTARSGKIPPFQMTAMTFALGTLAGLGYARATGQSLGVLRQVPPGAWALGICGLFGFHVCYFLALQMAPALEASLIVYLWPLLIVLFSGLLPAHLGGRGLRWWHVLGAGLGFAGTGLILLDRASGPAASGSRAGLAFALLAAVIWSSYSVGSRLFQKVPTIAVIGSCAATTAGALTIHLMTERFVMPADTGAWLAILALGLGPVGIAFYLWDEGMKHGDIRLLGAASYATPLVSAVILAALGLGQAGRGVWLAAVLITAGAIIASRE